MVKTFDSYQAALKYEFDRRQKRNPMYSLRAYARDLDLSPSHLSKVLSNKSGLSTYRAMIVAKNMGLQNKSIKWFKSLVEAQHSRNKYVKERAQKSILKYEGDELISPELKLNIPKSAIQNIKHTLSAQLDVDLELFLIDSKLLPDLEELIHEFVSRLRYLANKNLEGDEPMGVLVGAIPLLRGDQK